MIMIKKIQKIFMGFLVVVIILGIASLVYLKAQYDYEYDEVDAYTADFGKANINIITQETIIISGSPWTVEVDAKSSKVPDAVVPGKEIERNITAVSKGNSIYVQDGRSLYRFVIQKPFYYGEVDPYFSSDSFGTYVFCTFHPKERLMELMWSVAGGIGICSLIYCLLLLLAVLWPVVPKKEIKVIEEKKVESFKNKSMHIGRNNRYVGDNVIKGEKVKKRLPSLVVRVVSEIVGAALLVLLFVHMGRIVADDLYVYYNVNFSYWATAGIVISGILVALNYALILTKIKNHKKAYYRWALVFAAIGIMFLIQTFRWGFFTYRTGWFKYFPYGSAVVALFCFIFSTIFVIRGKKGLD